jgi:hypothetical protein
VFVDLNTKAGLAAAFEALLFLVPHCRSLLDSLSIQLQNQQTRVSIRHHGTQPSTVDALLQVAQQALNQDAQLNAAGRLVASALNGETSLPELISSMSGTKKQRKEAIEKYYNDSADQISAYSVQSRFLFSHVAQGQPSDAVIVVNDQVYEFPNHHELFSAKDYQLLVQVHITNGIFSTIRVPLLQHLPFARGTSSEKSVIALIASSVLSRPRQVVHGLHHAERVPFSTLQEFLTSEFVIKSEASSESNLGAAHTVVAVVNPLSREAQMIAPLLQFLNASTNIDLYVAFNPQTKLSDLPLKRFYQFQVRTALEFDAAGEIVMNGKAIFKRLPAAPLLTLILHTPTAWMSQALHSTYDLDNIHLDSANGPVRATFELQHLLLEGSCVNHENRPAAGVQLQLGINQQQPSLYDTIVMSNLGYFQLKALPGSWVLRLRPGRSTTVYEINQIRDFDGKRSTMASSNLVIQSFTGKFIQVSVKPLPGMERVRLLDIDESNEPAAGIHAEQPAPSSLWQSFTGMFRSKPEPSPVAIPKDNSVQRHGETIHVFSLASGHLYERFMKIMMLSVLKNTQHPVKFWFLENCMSPSFKSFLPSFANSYGFQYELVQYNWPSWLNKQTEKHRVIWAYKILFLDVLFPLSVKKIIFVDADQIVRADLQELVELDLEGAPYGYTPFCSSREDMDGFRFWKSGYWHGHLRGRSYHISALYVIDLVRFRQIAAGDQLREQYQQLSQDPNSLSNLDQDLPNFMIHQVWFVIFLSALSPCRYPSNRCRKNGSGARLGAMTAPRQLPRQSIFATIPRPKSPSSLLPPGKKLCLSSLDNAQNRQGVG